MTCTLVIMFPNRDPHIIKCGKISEPWFITGLRIETNIMDLVVTTSQVLAAYCADSRLLHSAFPPKALLVVILVQNTWQRACLVHAR